MADLREIGRTGLRTYAGQIYDSPILKLQGPGRNDKLRTMAETDDIVGGIISTFEVMGQSVEWWMKPKEEGNTEAEELAEFYWSALNDMAKPWVEVQSDIDTMYAFGFAPLEIVYKARRGPDQKQSKFRSKFNDNKIGWRKWPLRAQTSIDRWEFDDAQGVDVMVQVVEGDVTAQGISKISIPIEKILLFRTTTKKDNPEGRAIAENSFRTWFKKNHLGDIEAIAAENNLVGIPYVIAPERINEFNPTDNAAKKEMDEAMSQLSTIRHGEASAIVLPFGWSEPRLVQSPGAPTVDIRDLMKYYDSRIAISMLAGFVLTGMDKHGSFALSSNQLDMLIAAVNSYNTKKAEIVNRFAVPRLAKLNGHDQEILPTLEHGQPDYSTVEQAIATIKALGGLGSEMALLENVHRQLLGKVGLKVTEEDMEELREREEEKEARAEEMMKNLQKQPPFPKNLDDDEEEDEDEE